ncbi:MAG TPA: hypothetical protein VF533_12065 [Solirubrobacteraceae bacterium]|jgi:hypothetical protein
MIAAIAATALLAGAGASPAHAAATRDCGRAELDGTRFPVQIAAGDISCDDAVATLRAFFEQAAPPAGWVCALGHYGEAYAAHCGNEAGVLVEALNPPSVAAPRRTRVGKRITAVGSGLVPGKYTLTLVSDDAPVRGARCLARIGRRRATRGGWVTLRGRVPRKLRCYQGLNVFLGKVSTLPGAYHLVVGVKIGHAGWDGDHTFIRRRLRVR